MDAPQFVYLFAIEGLLGCFQFGTVMNKAAINGCMYSFLLGKHKTF